MAGCVPAAANVLEPVDYFITRGRSTLTPGFRVISVHQARVFHPIACPTCYAFDQYKAGYAIITFFFQ